MQMIQMKKLNICYSHSSDPSENAFVVDATQMHVKIKSSSQKTAKQERERFRFPRT